MCLAYFYLLSIPQNLVKNAYPYSYALYSREGVLMGAQVAQDYQWRFEPSVVPDNFKKAIVTYEDKRFWYHPGVDPISIIRAIRDNSNRGRIVSGGSTITMQTVRIAEHNRPRTISQKIHESILALLMELRFTKSQILELYSATAPFGGNVVGLEAASWRYFNRPPQTLTWAEAATLAVLPNQPSLVYPGANKAILQAKRDSLLHEMFSRKYFDQETLELSLQEPLPEKPYPLPSLAPHYLEYLKKTSPGKTKFFTGIDYTVHRNTSRILEKWSMEFSRMGIENAAALIIDTKSGSVVSYIGNSGFERNTGNWSVDLVQSKRSSGSLLKPFLYGAMIDNGMLMPRQLVTDIPTRIGSYRPDNNIPVYRGVIRADEALSRSLNIPAVRELQQYGISAFLDVLRQSGFTTFKRDSDYYGLPLILGGGELTMWEAVRAYADIMNAAYGRRTLSPAFPLSRGAAYLTCTALEDGIRPDDEALWQSFAHSKRIAWKTGTSSGNRDTWAIGTTSEYTVGVWFGNAPGQGNKNLTSVQTAAPVLFDIFNTLGSTHWPKTPDDNLVERIVCSRSGYLAGPHCSETSRQYTSSVAPRGTVCPYCRTVSFTPDGEWQANVSDMTGPYAGMMPLTEERFVLPPQVERWYIKHTLGYISLPPFVSWHNSAEKDDLAIVFPNQDARMYIPIEIDGTPGEIVMEAADRNAGSIIYWDIDGNYIGTSDSIHQMSARLEPGEHVLTITNSMGTQRRRNFTILGDEMQN